MLKKIFFFKPSPSISQSSSLQSKTFSDSLMEENIETAHTLITKWSTFPASNRAKTTPPLLFTNTHHDAKEFLNTIKRLHSTMMHLIAQDSSSQTLVKAQSLMQCAMKRLEMELYRFLVQTKDGLETESLTAKSSIIDEDWAERDLVSKVKAIAECMVSAGYSQECVRVYIMVRKPIVDEALYNLGVERLSFSQVQKMEWEVIESRIKCWLNAVKLAFGTLFHGEKALCDCVFGSPERNVAESCLAETCRDAAACLFGFAENVAKCKKTPEKMFRTLDLYEAISENRHQIESIFSTESTSVIRSQATATQARLAEAVRTMLSDFESAIQKESSKIPVPGGGIHPLTRYAMNYIAFLADYSDTLAEIVTDWPPQNPLPESYYGDENSKPSSEMAEMLAWLILVILCKLDGKAKLYKDTALSYLFLANNMQYVVVKVRKSNLGFLLGEDWLTKHEAKVKEYASKYERAAWSTVLETLPENSTAEETTAIFQSFNAAFVEACGAQSSWVVPDPKLREEIKALITLKAVARYRKFYERFRVGSESVIRFSPDDLVNWLSGIFGGSERMGL